MSIFVIAEKISLQSDVLLSGGTKSVDYAAVTRDCAEILQLIRLSRKYRNVKIPPSVNLDNALWDHIGSVKKSEGKDPVLHIDLNCSSLDDYRYLSMKYICGDLQSLLEPILLNEEMREKHSLGDVKLGVNIPPEELKKTLQKLQKARRQEESLEVTDLDTDMATGLVLSEPSCSTWGAAKRYLESMDINGK